ncbi:30983_t:CDS:2, partial [Gigaspora margarita]
VYSQCNYNTKCKCPSSAKQGQYCGNAPGMIGCDSTHVYECNPYGKVCDYGLRFSCAQCGNLTCPKVSLPTKPPNSSKPPTKPPTNPLQKLPSSTCKDHTALNYIKEACDYLAKKTMMKQVLLGVSLKDITTSCIMAAAPYALETLGGSEFLCGGITYFATKAVAAGIENPTCDFICK